MLTVLLAAGVGLLQVGSSSRLQAARTTADISARAAADAGVERAISLMNSKLNVESIWDNDTLPAVSTTGLPNCNADYSFSVSGDASSGFVISSTGTSAMAARTVSGRLVVRSYWFGLAAAENISIADQVEVDTIPSGAGLMIATNDTRSGNVKIGNNAVVNGDIRIGPGGAVDSVVDRGTDSLVTGRQYAADEMMEFAPVIVPEDLWNLPSNSYVYQPGVALSGNLKFNKLEIPDAGFQVITGNCRIYVAGDVNLKSNCWLVIPTDSSLSLYIDGHFEDYSASITNQSGNPSRFRILGTDTCNRVKFRAGSNIHAVTYAPTAEIFIESNANFYGACVGRKITVKPTGNFYYPVSLAQSIGINDESAYFATDYWWE
jgi:hypothetical protein